MNYFNYNFYISYHKDLKEHTYNQAILHFKNYGINEGRIFNSKLIHFDYLYYRKKAKLNSSWEWYSVCIHFLHYNLEIPFNVNLKYLQLDYYKNKINENNYSYFEYCNHLLNNYEVIFNNKLEYFNYVFYKELYYDELSKYNWLETCNHFLKMGIKEHRVFNEKLLNFDYYFYIHYNNLTDLNYFDACIHYLQNTNLICNENELNEMSKLKFIHITKNAGTSIEEIGLKKYQMWGKYDRTYSKKYSGWHEPFINKPLDYKIKYDWFLVVRCPYSRVVSEFNFCNKAFNLNLINVSEINKYIQKSISNYHKYELKYHFYPQWLYYDTKNNIKTTILKFENLETDFNNLMKEYSLDLKLDIHKQKSEKVFTVNELSNETIKLINEVYSKDFKLFAYKMIK